MEQAVRERPERVIWDDILDGLWHVSVVSRGQFDGLLRVTSLKSGNVIYSWPVVVSWYIDKEPTETEIRTWKIFGRV